jgi:pyruvate dehydrogenase E1 component
VIAGAYALRRHPEPQLTIAFVGAMATEALSAAERLDELGFGSDVICVTSPGLIFEALQASVGLGTTDSWILEAVFPRRRATPMVTVLDGHPHTLAFLAGINQVGGIHLGVSGFGQSGDLGDLHQHYGIGVESIVTAGLDLVD